jgi:hypothetical protein
MNGFICEKALAVKETSDAKTSVCICLGDSLLLRDFYVGNVEWQRRLRTAKTETVLYKLKIGTAKPLSGPSFCLPESMMKQVQSFAREAKDGDDCAAYVSHVYGLRASLERKIKNACMSPFMEIKMWTRKDIQPGDAYLAFTERQSNSYSTATDPNDCPFLPNEFHQMIALDDKYCLSKMGTDGDVLIGEWDVVLTGLYQMKYIVRITVE